MKGGLGPPIQMGAKIFLIIEYFLPLEFMKAFSATSVLIPFPATPILPFPSPVGIIQTKNPGYFSASNSISTVLPSIQFAYISN
jgi:hypothetical protein